LRLLRAHNKHHESLSSPAAASTHGDPLVRLKKKRLIRLNRRTTNKPPNGSFRAA
jgi:hypothetical protein